MTHDESLPCDRYSSLGLLVLLSAQVYGISATLSHIFLDDEIRGSLASLLILCFLINALFGSVLGYQNCRPRWTFSSPLQVHIPLARSQEGKAVPWSRCHHSHHSCCLLLLLLWSLADISFMVCSNHFASSFFIFIINIIAGGCLTWFVPDWRASRQSSSVCGPKWKTSRSSPSPMSESESCIKRPTMADCVKRTCYNLFLFKMQELLCADTTDDN